MEATKAETVSNDTLQSYYDFARQIVDFELLSLKPTVNELKLQRLIEYVLHSKGKLLRPVMVLLGGESVGGDPRSLHKLTLAIELLHMATLVHDDILDGDLFRRDGLSVQAKWGVKEAILVGDALASLSLKLCENYPKEILNLMAKTCLQLSDGEYMDMECRYLAFSEKHYLERVNKKTSSLFVAAVQCGAIASRGSAKELEALRIFGENFGIAFQVKDDVSDLLDTACKGSTGNRGLPITLPIVHLYKSANRKDQQLLECFASKKQAQIASDDTFIRDLHPILQECGALQYCAEKIDLHVEKAISALEGLRATLSRSYLAQMAESLKQTQTP